MDEWGPVCVYAGAPSLSAAIQSSSKEKTLTRSWLSGSFSSTDRLFTGSVGFKPQTETFHLKVKIILFNHAFKKKLEVANLHVLQNWTLESFHWLIGDSVQGSQGHGQPGKLIEFHNQVFQAWKRSCK